ncbi:MAG: hypothetical protein Q9160_007327 [Pyrenula sp. 1 TL-2023]
MDLTEMLNPEPSKQSAPTAHIEEPSGSDVIIDAEPFIYIKDVDDGKDTRKETERYACYVKGCDNNKGKYFTRPRSVLEHIQKFHNSVTWDRSKCARYEKDANDPFRYNLKISTRGKSNRASTNQKTTNQAIQIDTNVTSAPQDDPVTEQSTDQRPEQEPEQDVEKHAEPHTEEYFVQEPEKDPEEKVDVQTEDPIEEPAEEPASPDEPAPPTVPAENEQTAPLPPIVTKSTKRGATKKGTAKSTKKLRPKKTNNSALVKEEGATTPTTPSVSGTPVTARLASDLVKKQSSMSIASSPTAAEPMEDNLSATATEYEGEDDEEGSEDENAVYCVCRKGDNHTWMVSCDGGCDEWFHGDCVGILPTNHDVIDKFFCPNCEKEGKGRTTYKPHCSFVHCENPAKYPSKYCSDKCGQERIAWALALSDPIWAYENDKYQYCINAGSKPLPKSYLKRNGLIQNTTDFAISNAATKEIILGPTTTSASNGGGGGSGGGGGIETPPSDDETQQQQQNQSQRDTPLSPPLSDADSLSDEEELPTRGGALRASELAALISHAGSDAKKFKDLGNPSHHHHHVSRKAGAPLLAATTHRLAALALRPDESALFDARLEFLEKVKARAADLGVCGYDGRLALGMEAFREVREKGGLEIGGAGDGICQGKKRCGRHVNWAKVALNDVKFERELARKGGRRF